MDIITAETLLWRDFDEAIDERFCFELKAQHPELQDLAEKLNSFLLSVDKREGRLMMTALQLAQTINAESAEPNVVEVRNEIWPTGAVILELSYVDHGRAVMNIGAYSIHSSSYYRDTLISEKRNLYTPDTLAACDYSITTLALRHLAWLRSENHHLQKFLAERRAAQADLP